MVSTPNGVKYHGYIEGQTFYRSVTAKDYMRIFDAWSINPMALEQLKKEGVKDLFYKNVEDHKEYKITLEDVIKHGFKRSFKGGETWYIPMKQWNKPQDNQIKLL